MNTLKYIIIPDVHGRTFWRDVVTKYLNEDVTFIFLGDYLDSYGYENIKDKDAYQGLLDIIEYKKQYPNKFILLLGNHDLHYLTDTCRGSRWDLVHSKRNAAVFKDNAALFQMTYSDEIDGKKFFFSHAGITKGWIYDNHKAFDIHVPDKFEDFEINDWTELPEFNRMLWSYNDQEKLFDTLGDVSFYRGGSKSSGSIVWADYHEHLRPAEQLPGIIQVFGHTQQEKDPINIDNKVYCLDCRRAFCIDTDGNLLELDGSELPVFDTEGELKAEQERLERLAAFFF